MNYEITFLRHGSSEGGEKNVLQGHLDFPLSPNGRMECVALAKYWKENGVSYDLIISSPLTRAFETGQIISSSLTIPIEKEKIWIERDFGSGEGKDLEIIKNWYRKTRSPDCFDPLYESGESEWAIHMRAGKALESLFLRKPAKYIIVSHGNFINAISHVIFGILPQGRSKPITMSLCNSGYVTFKYDTEEDRWFLEVFNNTTHSK
jgi:broad specificity phosphatase PhoE